MSDQDRYIPGVPCWVDTTPARSRGRRRLLRRPVRLGVRGRDAARRAAALLRRPGCRAATSPRSATSRPARRRGRRGTPTCGWRTPTRPPRKVARPGARCHGAGRRRRRGAHGGVRRPRGRRVLPSGRPSTHRGAAVVNEPGSLNFNDLHTRDLDGAQAFYGAVFGWEVLDAGRARLWALPGLRRLPRAAHARACARAWPRWARPARFEEVVASLVPIADDQPDTPPHWGVTFARRRRRRDRRARGRARRPGGRAAVRRAVGADDRHRRPAGRDVHGQQVRAGEQGPRRDARARPAPDAARAPAVRSGPGGPLRPSSTYSSTSSPS